MSEAASQLIAGGDLAEDLPKNKLQSLIECMICKGVAFPPIYNCKLGHSICGACRPKMTQEKCGLCSYRYTGSRNFALEEIVRNCVFACEFREQGCLLLLNGSDYKKHVYKCEFGPKNRILPNPGDKYKWSPMRNGRYLDDGVKAGIDHGTYVYVARANFPSEAYLTPGKLHATHNCAYIPHGRYEHPVYEYEVLSAASAVCLEWIPFSGVVPEHAVPGGYDINEEIVYIGRASIDGGNVTTGKVCQGVCFVPYAGREHRFRTFDILVENVAA